MVRVALVCCALCATLAVAGADASAAEPDTRRLCEPGELASSPEPAQALLEAPGESTRCVPGMSSNAECAIEDPAGAPHSGGVDLGSPGPRAVQPGWGLPDPDAAGADHPGDERGGPQPGHPRGIDRPPQR